MSGWWHTTSKSTHNTTCAPDARASWYLYPPCHGGEEEADYGKGEEGCCGCRCFSVAQDTKPGVDCGGMVPFELFYGSISCLPPPAFHRRAKDKAQNQPPIARRLFPTLYGAVISQLHGCPSQISSNPPDSPPDPVEPRASIFVRIDHYRLQITSPLQSDGAPLF